MSRDGAKLPTIEFTPAGPRLARVSPTQLKTFKLCPRKWWLEKRAKLPRKPPGKGAALGDKCHKQIEHFANTGEDVRGEIARVGAEMLAPYVPFLPFNKGPITVEPAIASTLRTPGGVGFVGYIDLLVPPGVVRPEPVIIDHKFRKDLERYAEKAEELETDDQAIIYSRSALELWPETRAVEFRHHNHQTEGMRYADPVSIVLTREKVLDGFARICETVDRKMQHATEQRRDIDVEANEEGCSAFGGCDFLKVCPNAPARRFARTLLGESAPPSIDLEKTDMGLLDEARRLAAASSATVATAPSAASTVAVVIPATPAAVAEKPNAARASEAKEGRIYMVTTSAGQKLAKLDAVTPNAVFFVTAEGAPVRAAPTDTIADLTDTPIARERFGLPPLAAAVAAPAPAAPKASRLVIHDVSTPVQGAGSAVNPPDAAPPAKNPEELAARVLAQAAAGVAAPVVEVAPPAPAVAAEAPKKRGRPPGAKNKPGTVEQVATGEAAAHVGGLDGLILCVDVAVSKPATDLAAYVADLAATIAESVGAPDVRFADKASPLGFGAWKGALAAAALKSPPEGLCVIHSSELAEPVIEALAGIASLVVRGAR